MTKEHERPVEYPCPCQVCRQQPGSPTAEEHRTLNRLLASTDERQRRLIAGFLARQHGRGGIAQLAQITGLSRSTILRGQRELLRPDRTLAGRVRRPGAGRPRAEKKVPRS